MIQLTLCSMTMITSIIFTQMNHPLAMGLMLLLQTILVSLITGTMAKSFWFSYILFLIFLGGMLVLFIYVTSLASNEMFSMSSILILMSTVIMMMFIIFISLTDKISFYTLLMNNEMMSIETHSSYSKENMINLLKLYNYPTNMITIILMNYLLITLIAIVKITNMFYGPLRPMN